MNAISRLFAASLASFLAASSAFAAKPLALDDVDVNEHISDTQKSQSRKSKHVDLVWWMTKEFWLAANKGEDESTKKELAKTFDKYMIVAVLDADIVDLGEFDATDSEKIRVSMRIKDVDGQIYAPIAEDKISTEFQILIGTLRPLIRNMLGKMGDNIQFYVFPASNGNKRIGNPYADGKFVIQMLDNDYGFRLPLNSLLEKKKDATTGEMFPGSYSFNPYDGKPLSDEKSKAATDK